MLLTCSVAASKLADALLAARESRQEEEARSDSARSASMFCAISAPVFLKLQSRVRRQMVTVMITMQSQKHNSSGTATKNT